MLGDLERHYEIIAHYGRTLFGDMLPQQDAARIPVVLSPVVKEHTYKADDHYRSRKITKLAQERCGDISQEEVLKIMRQKTFTMKVAGEFCEGDRQFGPYIVLYYNVIDGSCPWIAALLTSLWRRHCGKNCAAAVWCLEIRMC